MHKSPSKAINVCLKQTTFVEYAMWIIHPTYKEWIITGRELTLKIARYSNCHGSKYLNELHVETRIYFTTIKQYTLFETIITIITCDGPTCLHVEGIWDATRHISSRIGLRNTNNCQVALQTLLSVFYTPN